MHFRQWLESAWGGKLQYKVPEDKEHILFDFYMLSAISSPKTEETRFAVKEVEDILLPYLKRFMLDAVYFSLMAELRHTFDHANYGRSSSGYSGGIYDDLEDPRHQDLLDKYKQNWHQYDRFVDRMERDKPQYHADLDSSVNAPDKSGKERSGAWLSAVATSKNRVEMVELSKEVFVHPSWDKHFGGQAWADIADGWLKLNRAKSKPELYSYIDHMYDLQHNNGSVFNKIRSYIKNGEYAWLGYALNYKAQVRNPFELYDKISPDFKSLAARALKEIYGKDLEDHLENPEEHEITQRELEDKFRAVEAAHPIKNPLVTSHFELNPHAWKDDTRTEGYIYARAKFEFPKARISEKAVYESIASMGRDKFWEIYEKVMPKKDPFKAEQWFKYDIKCEYEHQVFTATIKHRFYDWERRFDKETVSVKNMVRTYDKYMVWAESVDKNYDYVKGVFRKVIAQHHLFGSTRNVLEK